MMPAELDGQLAMFGADPVPGPASAARPEQLALWDTAELEAERMRAVMGDAWADGMYD